MSHTTLHEELRIFQDYVLGSQRANSQLEALIDDRFGLSAPDRLAIYYDAYRIRLAEAMAEAFDKTHGYIGDDLFGKLSAGYVESHPSPYSNLRWYGGEFAAYAGKQLSEYPVVSELAAFEWALGSAFDAADATVLAAQQLQSLTQDDWEQIGFHLHPSLQLLALHWNAPGIWLALEQEVEPPEASRQASPGNWLVWRKDLQPHFRSITEDEAAALRGLARGMRFSAVCGEVAANSGKDVTADVATWLQSWLGEGILSAIRTTGIGA